MLNAKYKLITSTLIFISFFIFNGVHANNFIDFWENENQETVSIGSIYMTGSFLEEDIIKISVFTEGFTSPVLGIAFHLNYEGEKLAFLKYEPGKFLENGGDPFYMVENNPLKQKLYFGATLRREDSFPVGGDKLADFYFQNKGEKEFMFEFDKGVVSTLDVVRQDLNNVNWKDLFLDKENAVGGYSNLQTSTINTAPSEGKYFYYLLILHIFSLILSLTLIVLTIKYSKANFPYSSEGKLS